MLPVGALLGVGLHQGKKASVVFWWVTVGRSQEELYLPHLLRAPPLLPPGLFSPSCLAGSCITSTVRTRDTEEPVRG